MLPEVSGALVGQRTVWRAPRSFQLCLVTAHTYLAAQGRKCGLGPLTAPRTRQTAPAGSATGPAQGIGLTDGRWVHGAITQWWCRRRRSHYPGTLVRCYPATSLVASSGRTLGALLIRPRRQLGKQGLSLPVRRCRIFAQTISVAGRLQRRGARVRRNIRLLQFENRVRVSSAGAA